MRWMVGVVPGGISLCEVALPGVEGDEFAADGAAELAVALALLV